MPSSALVLLSLAALVLALLGISQLRRKPGRTRPADELVRRWVSGRATTADGVTAELHVEFVLRPETGLLDDSLDQSAQDAVESAVRNAITSSTLDRLPDAGDTPGWLDAVEVPGARIEHAVVTDAGVWVTPELRRLVAGGGGGPGAWT